MVPSLLRVASLAWLRRCSRRRALAERIALKTPLQSGGWNVLPNDIGTELTRDFPDLMEARYQMFGRGGPRAAPAIPRRAAIADASALARAQAERSRQREATAKAEERTEKISKQLAESKLALFNSQEETDAANERLHPRAAHQDEAAADTARRWRTRLLRSGLFVAAAVGCGEG